MTISQRVPCCLGYMILVAASMLGCTSSSGYPDVQVTEVAGTTQSCHQCGKSIATVQDENFLQIGAAQYIVCGGECQIKQSAWHEAQFGKAE
jgi:hypothetical protein